jgi:uncharacterized protein (DUF885 family)
LGHERQEDIEASRKQRKAFRDRARAIDAKTLSADDRTTLQLLAEDLEADIGTDICEAETWELSSYASPVAATNHLPELHLVSKVEAGKHLLARYLEIERVIGERRDNLRRGLREGRVASREGVKRLLTQLDRQLEKPVREWSLVTILSAPAAKARRKDFTAAEEAAFVGDARVSRSSRFRRQGDFARSAPG